MPLVQGGTVEFGSSVGSVEVTLGTPVSVGNSFAIVTARPIGGHGSFPAQVELIDISGGKYQKINVRRNGWGTAVAEWQVIEGSKFTVQSGVAEFTGTSTTATITAVTLTKAFITVGWRHANAFMQHTMIRAKYNSTTQIELGAIASSAKAIAWYVVEWEGATVQQGDASMASVASIDVTITAVTLAQTVLLFTYNSNFTQWDTRYWTRGRLTSTTNIRFNRRFASSITNGIYYFVISHPGMTVQSGTGEMSGTGAGAGALYNDVTVTSVALDLAAVFANLIGNSYNSAGGSDSEEAVAATVCTHRLTSATNLRIQRALDSSYSDSARCTYAWFVAVLPPDRSPWHSGHVGSPLIF